MICSYSSDCDGKVRIVLDRFCCGVRHTATSYEVSTFNTVLATRFSIVIVSSDEFLSSWMGQMMPFIGNQTILDLALPGTHGERDTTATHDTHIRFRLAHARTRTHMYIHTLSAHADPHSLHLETALVSSNVSPQIQ